MKNININNEGFTIRALEDRDFIQLTDLYNSVFNKQESPNYLRNKYNLRHIINDYCSAVAVHNDQVVGFYGAIPQVFQHRGEAIFFAHGSDFMTATKFRRMGLNYHLSNYVNTLLLKHQISMIYSFLNEYSFQSTKKSGWSILRKMCRFHIPSGFLPLAQGGLILGLNKWLLQRIESVFGPYAIPCDHIADFVDADNHEIWDAGYFNYKNCIYPHYLIQLYGCIFWIRVDAKIHVGFALAEEGSFEKGLRKLKSLARKTGIHEILFQVDPMSSMYSSLTRIARPLPSWHIGYKVLNDQIQNVEAFRFYYGNADTF